MYKRIKELRIDNDIKQSYIADILGIKQNSYSQIENGLAYPNSEYLIKLAKIYSTSVDYLLELTDVQKPYPRSK